MMKQKREYIQETINNVQRFLDEMCFVCEGACEYPSLLGSEFEDWCFENELLQIPNVVFFHVLKKLGRPTIKLGRSLDDMCLELSLR